MRKYVRQTGGRDGLLAQKILLNKGYLIPGAGRYAPNPHVVFQLNTETKVVFGFNESFLDLHRPDWRENILTIGDLYEL